MKKTSDELKLFYTLLQAGLWENRIDIGSSLQFHDNSSDDWLGIYRLAEEQGVVGLIASGLDYLTDVKAPKSVVLQFVGAALQFEQRNLAMNSFIAKAVANMQNVDINTLLVKGQGIAQCYGRPLWRNTGDVDFFLDGVNYEKAKEYWAPFSSGSKPERKYSKEKGYFIETWLVELHGSLRTGLSSRIDKAIDDVQKSVFDGKRSREWDDNGVVVHLPLPDDDVFLVFTHFIKHFYKEGGVTIRQICDWCRLLWTYRSELSKGLLESRIKKAGLLSEWKAFAALAVDYIGMPPEAMPLYCKNNKWKRKADKINTFILKGGEWRKMEDTLSVGRIFPLSTLRFSPGIILNANWLKIKEKLYQKD